MADGRLDDARTAWRHLAAQDAINAPEFIYRAARPALWQGDVDAARSDLAALDATGVHGSVVELRRLAIRAGLAALEGRPADALGQYREALRGWHELGLAWDEAMTGIDMATLLDPSEPEVRAAAESSRQILARLGAKPFVDRLDSAMGRSTSPELSISPAAETTTSRSATRVRSPSPAPTSNDSSTSAASRQTSSRVGRYGSGAGTRNQEGEADRLVELSRSSTQDVAGRRGLHAGVLADLDVYLAAGPRLS
jgi:hypothetical protein